MATAPLPAQQQASPALVTTRQSGPSVPGEPLSRYMARVKRAIEQNVPASTWVIGEVVDAKAVTANAQGHVYFELAEKNPDTGQIVARARCTMWSSVARKVLDNFMRCTGAQITPGTKLMCLVDASFSPGYGFALNVKDIDPTYTLGDIARRRREILAQLEAEGLLELNKKIELPLMPQSIAVISSAQAAGYLDFVQQLTNNRHGLKFSITLFQSHMQGAETEAGVYQALRDIYLRSSEFDAIVIIRGGGSAADLMWFDSYRIGKAIALSKLPVLTGIGHEQDETIADLVAHRKLKTPTAVAEFLVDTMLLYLGKIEDLAGRIDRCARTLLAQSELHMSSSRERLNRAVQGAMNHAQLQRQEFLGRLQQSQQQALWRAKELLMTSRQRLQASGLLAVQQAQQRARLSESRLEAALQARFSYHNSETKRMEQAINQAAHGAAARALQQNNHHAQRAAFMLQQCHAAFRRLHDSAQQRLQLAAETHLRQALTKEERLREQLRLADPRNVLARGFSIVRFDGHAVKRADEIPAGATFDVQTACGSFTGLRPN